MAASKLAIKLTARVIRKWSGRWTLEQHGRLEILDQETAGGKSKEREATLLSRLKIFSLFPFFFLSDIFRSQVFYLHFPEFANSLLDIFLYFVVFASCIPLIQFNKFKCKFHKCYGPVRRSTVRSCELWLHVSAKISHYQVSARYFSIDEINNIWSWLYKGQF